MTNSMLDTPPQDKIYKHLCVQRVRGAQTLTGSRAMLTFSSFFTMLIDAVFPYRFVHKKLRGQCISWDIGSIFVLYSWCLGNACIHNHHQNDDTIQEADQ